MSLQSQLEALQSENVSLSKAASEAFNLAETLVLDNAKLQKQVHDLSSQVDELRQLAKSCSSTATGTTFPNAALVAAFRTHADILSLSSEAPSIAAVHHALVNSSAIIALALFALTSHSSRSSSADPLSNPLETATVIGNAVATFLLSDPALAMQRTKQLDEALVLLRDRVSDVAQSRSSGVTVPPPATDSSVTHDLLQMAVSAVLAILPASIATGGYGFKATFASNGGLTPEAYVSLKQISRSNADSATEHGAAEAVIKPDPQISRLKQALTRRERELDDLHVRHTAFEQSLRIAVAEADALRKRLISVEAVPAPDIESQPQTPCNSTLARAAEEPLETFTSTSQIGDFGTPVCGVPAFRSPSLSISARGARVGGEFIRSTPRCTQSSSLNSMTGPIARIAQEQLRRLRTTYSVSAAESLLRITPENGHFLSKFDAASIGRKSTVQNDTMNQFYHALRTAHSSGRKAAACARVAQLDKETLVPVSRGATLSLRRCLETIACSRRMNPLLSKTVHDSETRQKTNGNIVLNATINSDLVDEFARTLGLQARYR